MKLIFGLVIVVIVAIGIKNLIKSTGNSKSSKAKAAQSSFILSEQQRQSMSHLHDQHARVFDDDCNHPGCDSNDSGSCDSGSDGGCSGGCD
ncbi:MAG: hypothetical protein RR539_09790 [Clostridium sp.]|uniref:hypothetical protein n=1 Tax=Clostridium sp. TaxID=1506 RepID=UPI002FCBF066